MAHQRTRSIYHTGAASEAEVPRYAGWEHASPDSAGERLSASSAAHGASLVLDWVPVFLGPANCPRGTLSALADSPRSCVLQMRVK
jgi:hypothetical protein